MADKGKGIADDSSSSKRKRNGDDKSGNRKRKNRNVLQFFEDSAFEIDESGSSDEDDFINDDINIYFEEDVGPDPEVKAEPKTPNTPFFPKEEDMDEEEMDKLMEERYKPGAGFVKYAEDRSKTARMDERNTFIPLEKDPPIWKVKCTVGRERHSAFCLMQKYVDLKALGTKLQIISAFAVEHVKGFIFIEAEKQRDINEACKGLCYIYPSRVAVVPVSEVSHLFSVRSKYSGVSADTWARVKNGKYKGDLAQVVFVDEAKRKVTVKLVPRIDLQAVSEKFGGGVTAKKNTIPAPRLVTSSELEAYRPLIQYRRDRDTNDMYEVFDGMTLKDGYLYKKVPLDSLSFWDVRPSEAELIKFTPANKEESNDAEWLTGLFGERKKKGPSVSKINTGGKGESSSSSAMENGFEVPDLVLHGRKAFGIVIGREKDDRIKVLEEGSDRPMVVAVESRLLKKADFDKKFTAFDQHKKIISINDTVRILEGPLEDKRGIVKQIYKGVIFLHDENETENCGYFCAKAQICEKMNFSADIFKGGKGGKSDASGFDDMPTSPKSPLSPNKAWEGRDNTRNFDQEDKEGLSVGQSCRIRVGPLKGYMCRVMAIRYSDITVKLDSQHKILTVKSEHLAEVRAKSSAVSLGDGQDSAKPFELLGESGSSQGWMDAGATSEPGGGGWNTGGQSTERSAWAPFSANSSGDNDANKEDAGGSGWDTKTTQDTIPWGASSSENKTGGWGASSSGVKNDSSDDAGWGNAGGSNGGENKPAWGSAPAPATEDKNTPAWGKQDTAGGENKPAWGSAPAPASEGGGWGSLKKDESTSAWGNQDTAGGENKSAWGSAPAPASESGSAGGWGSAKQDENKTGWGKQDTTTTGGSSWGNKQASDGGNKDEDGVGAWGKKVDTGGESGKWGSADKAEGGGSGWGNSKDTGGSSWSKPADGGGSSWSKPADGGGSSWSKPADGGGSSWGSQDGGGGSSWSKQEGRSGGGGGGNACFKCGETGHMSRECPQGGGGGGGSRNCYKCGESGHMSRECPKGGGGGGGNACFKCGETGHMSRECPQGGSGGGNRNCYKCGESGHMSRECPKGGGGGGGGNSCFKCGEAGHMSRECPQGGGGGGNKSCYKCGESGHMSRECPQGGSGGGGGGGRSCYKCGESGHMSRECPQGGGGGGGGGGRSCYKCGESGHMSRECPQGGGGGGGGGGRSCYKCGESGHMSRECPQGGGGGGGRNCFKCGESGHMSRECPQGGGGGSSGGGGGWSSSGGWGSNKGSDAGGGSAGGGGWSSSGGLGANKGSDAGGGSSGGGGGGGWSSSGGWGSSNKGPDAADGGKKDDAQGNQWGSSSGGQTAGWGSDGGGNAQGSGWGGGDQTGKKQGDGQTGGGWGSTKDSGADDKKDDAEGGGWSKKSGW